jgi:hypothetical protein
MVGLRVGVEVEAPAATVAAAMATLPWLAPEAIALDSQRSLVLVSTSFRDAVEACGYAVRRIQRSSSAIDLPIRIVSAEAFPALVDLRSVAREADDLQADGR